MGKGQAERVQQLHVYKRYALHASSDPCVYTCRTPVQPRTGTFLLQHHADRTMPSEACSVDGQIVRLVQQGLLPPT